MGTLFRQSIYRVADIPETIKANPELLEDFKNCIKENRKVYNKILPQVDPRLLIYLTPHGAAVDLVSTMNARELLHFMNLRTCTRAQWEIQEYAVDALKQLRKIEPVIFNFYGPSCYVNKCPEGPMTCGKALEIKEFFSSL